MNKDNEIVITVDDLIFEIGNLSVKELLAKKEKKAFTEAIVVLQSKIPELDKLKTELEVKTIKVEKSNGLYVTNNEKLSNALIDIRQDLHKKITLIRTLKSNLATVRKERTSLKRKLNKK